MANMADLCNVQAEKEVISAILSKPSCLHDVSGIITEDDFYRQNHRIIYSTMAMMILGNEPVDMVTLTERLKRDGNLEKVGGIMEISQIAVIGIIPRVEAQAQIIADYARRRRLINKGEMLQTMAADLQTDIDSLAFDFARDISGITSTADENTKTAKDAVLELAALIDKRQQRADEMLKTGLADVDKYLTNLEAGQLVVIAGRPGHGKTALAGTIAVNMAQKGKRVLMFSMEMSREELLARIVSRLGKIPGAKLKKPDDMTEKDWEKYTQAIMDVGRLPITINAQGALTPADVAAIASRWQAKDGLDVIMIDYLQLMTSGNKSDSRVQEISYITRSLKNLAVALKVPIILLSQLNRANDKENRAPRLTDLRDSGSIEQDANTVLLIHRETIYDDETKGLKLSNKTFVNIAKQRDGECGTVKLTFIPSRSQFVGYVDEGQIMSKGFEPPL